MASIFFIDPRAADCGPSDVSVAPYLARDVPTGNGELPAQFLALSQLAMMWRRCSAQVLSALPHF